MRCRNGFVDVAKVFDTWVDGSLYKLTVLNFPSYLLSLTSYLLPRTSSYLHGRTLETSFQTATSFWCVMLAGVAQGLKIAPRPVQSVCRHAYAIPQREWSVSPSDMESCCISSSSIQKWTARIFQNNHTENLVKYV